MPMITPVPSGRAGHRCFLAALLCLCLFEPALAQAKNPFSVGISEGGGGTTGFTGWILAQQGWFEHQLSMGVRAIKAGSQTPWPLIGLSFVYGVFHAAGPGHGKAVLASYMVANERAFRRGIVLSFLAALLQGFVAIVLVATLALVLRATAQHMKDTASLVETISFAAIVGLGLLLVWRKGKALLRLWPPRCPSYDSRRDAISGFFAPAEALVAPGFGAVLTRSTSLRTDRFICLPDDVSHPANCAHCHGPDPRTLSAARFSTRDAALTVIAAGLRPCSGAILVLVFSLSQGVLIAGIAAVLAMSCGVALTTAALASAAMFLKKASQRFLGVDSRRAALAGAVLELGAAGFVLCAGTFLLAGYTVASGS